MSKPNSGLFKGTKGSKYSNNISSNGNDNGSVNTKNKIEHILGDKNINKHNLGSVLKENNNDSNIAYNSVIDAIQNHIKTKNIKDGIVKDKVQYNNHIITFIGKVENGSYNPGTFYITEEDLKNEKKKTN